MALTSRSIAYFSMEIGIRSDIPTYAGGLGVLAGDTVRAAADMRVPMVAVTLLHRQGYFRQRLDEQGWQHEEPMPWPVQEHLRDTGARTTVRVDSRTVHVRAWQLDVPGDEGPPVPVLFLDTDLEENAPWDRTLTHYLYGGDSMYRLCQEVVLGIGGVRILRTLGLNNIRRFHMNEGHSALLTLELLDEQATKEGRTRITHEDIEAVHAMCVFTTHTPVPAGQDRFPLKLAAQVLGRSDVLELKEVFCCDDELNMTFLAMNLSRFINGVAKRHGEVSQHMFARYRIDWITNGVYPARWVADPMARLYDHHVSGWQHDNFSLRYALNCSNDAIWNAHQQSKQLLIDVVNQSGSVAFDAETLTIGFARRATSYKRPDLLFHDLDRLRRIGRTAGGLQLVFAGKAHPRDEPGKRLIQRIIRAGRSLSPEVRFVYLVDYDLDMALRITSGVDLWLNTPQPPLEASGTSGMKSALNGVPSLSVLDGWWIEGCLEGLTGWSIGDVRQQFSIDEFVHPADTSDADAGSLYRQLEEVILPMFLGNRSRFIDTMRHAIALNGSFFNTQRMMQQYVLKAYFE